MKKFLFLMTMVAGMFASCQDDNVVETPDKDYKTFTATFEKPSSRVVLGDDDYARWESGDQVSIFGAEHYTYTATPVTEDNRTAKLSYAGSGSPTFTNPIMAVFPYAANNSQGETNTLYSVLPAEQVYKKAMNNAIMVAVMPVSQADQTFVFKNSCALVKLNINAAADFTDAKVKSIKIESKSHALAGKIRINNDYTAVVETETSKSVTLTGCENAGDLSTTRSFLLVIPAGVYESGDLTVTVETDNDYLGDYVSTLYKNIEVGRSEYFVLQTTLGEGIELVDKAIMADIPKLVAAGYTVYGQDASNYEDYYEYPLPDSDREYDFRNKVYNFKSTSENVYIINTFTPTNGGVSGVTPYKVTVKNLTIKGELRTTTLGTRVSGTGWDGYNFNTEWEKVSVLDNKIIPMTEAGVSGANVSIGAAVSVYGTALLKNCTITGTKLTDSDYVEDHPSWNEIPIYDLASDNTGNVTIDGGTIGSIKTWEHTDLTIKGGATVASVMYTGIYVNGKFGHLTINDAKVQELIIAPHTSYTPQAVISKDAIIDVLKFESLSYYKKVDGEYILTDKDLTNYFKTVTIEEGATIGKIYVGDEELTLAEFKTKYMPTTATE